MRLFEFGLRHLYALGGFLVLAIVGPFSARHRAMVREVALHFGYRPPGTVRPRLPQLGIEEIVPPGIEVALEKLEAADGNVSVLELVAIAKLVRHAAPRSSFEIGTFDGRTTYNIAVNAPPEGRVHTLDLPPEAVRSTALPIEPADRKFIAKEGSGERFSGSAVEERIVQLWGDSATFDFGPFRNATDFVFVDGSHSYDYVMSDSLNVLGLLREGRGIIVWHDYGAWPGVTRALDELRAGGGTWSGLRHVRGTTLAVLRLE